MKKYFPYYVQNIRLAFPIVLSQLGQIVVQQADIMMVGYIGTKELAAIAFANSIFIFGMIFIIGFSLGITPMVGHIEDKKNHGKLAKILSNGLFINILATIFFMLILFVISFFFGNMGQEKIVVELSKPYFYTLILSMFPLTIFFTQKQFAEGIGDTKNAMYVTISANIINVFLNYILIFGKFGFPEYGILGAGIATLIARIYMSIVYTIIFRKKKIFKYIYEKVHLHLDKVGIKELLNLGFPISIQLLLEISAFAISGIMAGWLGVTVLASHQIGTGLSSVTFMLSLGVGAATTICISNKYSTKNLKSLVMTTSASSHIILFFMLLSAIVFYIFRYDLPYLYTQDIEVVNLSATILVAVAIYQVFDGLQVVMISVLRGLGDVKHAMFYSFIAYILINLPIGYLLAFYFEMGVLGLWIGFIFGLGLASILFYLRIKKIYSKLSE